MLSSEIERRHEELEPIMPYHFDRWSGLTKKLWEENISKAEVIYRKRPFLVINYVTKYFDLTQEEVDAYFSDFLTDESNEK